MSRTEDVKIIIADDGATIDARGARMINASHPTGAKDFATKEYVDATAGALDDHKLLINSEDTDAGFLVDKLMSRDTALTFIADSQDGVAKVNFQFNASGLMAQSMVESRDRSLQTDLDVNGLMDLKNQFPRFHQAIGIGVSWDTYATFAAAVTALGIVVGDYIIVGVTDHLDTQNGFFATKKGSAVALGDCFSCHAPNNVTYHACPAGSETIVFDRTGKKLHYWSGTEWTQI